MSRRCFILLAAVGCQAKSEKAPEPPRIVEVQDDHGLTLAKIQGGHPCHASFAGKDLVVDDAPSLQSDGATWTTEDRQNGKAMLKNGELVARIVSPPQEESASGELHVVDPSGIALVRIRMVRHSITVTTAGGVRLRDGGKLGPNLPIQVGHALITGTDDRLLAALIAAPEVPAEIRAIMACKSLSTGGA